MAVQFPSWFTYILREQSIALSMSFVEVAPHCPLFLCLVGDRSVRRRTTAMLLHSAAAAAAVTAAAAESPFLLTGVPSLLLVGVLRSAARCLPHSRATSWRWNRRPQPLHRLQAAVRATGPPLLEPRCSASLLALSTILAGPPRLRPSTVADRSYFYQALLSSILNYGLRRNSGEGGQREEATGRDLARETLGCRPEVEKEERELTERRAGATAADV
ncbi:hypothetical protein Scep_011713 [Stephania cephalantha]|uniref:Uncharacterized protein n=1 Tax=Stephania cephalantha TaxID=152367 RepID=A0AAP0JEP0_9MAGN